jgi:histidine triad (HIT) family protein
MAHYDWYCEDVLSGKVEVRVVWEDERVLAFHHPEPKAEVHVVVIPKAHVSSILAPQALDGELLLSMVMGVQETARATGLDKSGFFVRTNAAAPGVTPHMHWHVVGPGIPEMV